MNFPMEIAFICAGHVAVYIKVENIEQVEVVSSILRDYCEESLPEWAEIIYSDWED
jgi:hypothetical protein